MQIDFVVCKSMFPIAMVLRAKLVAQIERWMAARNATRNRGT